MACSDAQLDSRVEKFEGFQIMFKREDGYYWSEDGYFETVEECRDSISDWNVDYRAAHPEEEPIDEYDRSLIPWWEDR